MRTTAQQVGLGVLDQDSVKMDLRWLRKEKFDGLDSDIG